MKLSGLLLLVIDSLRSNLLGFVNSSDFRYSSSYILFQFTRFADVFDPLSPTRSLSQVLNLMDQFMDSPLVAASRGMGAAAGSRRGWDVKEDNEALHIRVDMPGLDKENMKISVEQNTLIIKGEGEKESKEGEYGRRYSSRLDLPMDLYKLDEIKAEMKNGVLKVRIPKVKEEERKDVFQVKVD